MLVYTIATGRWQAITDGLPSLNVTAFAARAGVLYNRHGERPRPNPRGPPMTPPAEVDQTNRVPRDRRSLIVVTAGILPIRVPFRVPIPGAYPRCPIHRSLLAMSGFPPVPFALNSSERPIPALSSPKTPPPPTPSILSLEEMSVEVTIDNGDAHVHIVQIFANHTANIEEGTYRFALPSGSTVSDFAVWDGPVRIPAVILERKRAEEIYEQAKSQAIDPGLLEAGERDGADPRQSAVFTR